MRPSSLLALVSASSPMLIVSASHIAHQTTLVESVANPSSESVTIAPVPTYRLSPSLLPASTGSGTGVGPTATNTLLVFGGRSHIDLAAIVVGGVLALVALSILIFCCLSKKPRQRVQGGKVTYTSHARDRSGDSDSLPHYRRSSSKDEKLYDGLWPHDDESFYEEWVTGNILSKQRQHRAQHFRATLSKPFKSSIPIPATPDFAYLQKRNPSLSSRSSADISHQVPSRSDSFSSRKSSIPPYQLRRNASQTSHSTFVTNAHIGRGAAPTTTRGNQGPARVEMKQRDAQRWPSMTARSDSGHTKVISNRAQGLPSSWTQWSTNRAMSAGNDHDSYRQPNMSDASAYSQPSLFSSPTGPIPSRSSSFKIKRVAVPSLDKVPDTTVLENGHGARQEPLFVSEL